MSANGPSGLALQMQPDRFKFRGMLPAEILVLKAWLAVHGGEYSNIDFNVRLGTGYDPGPNYPPEIRAQWIANTQKRLDALGWQGNQATIIECKRRAGLSNIGQVIGYKTLFLQQYPDLATPILLIVASSVQADIYTVAQAEGIQVEMVSADFSQLRRQGGPLRGHKPASNKNA